MELLKIFSERLSELLFEKNLTPERFSKIININLSNIYRYLRKESVPELQNSIKIANYFNCSLDFLFGLTDYNDESFINEINFQHFYTNFRKL